MLLRTLSTVQWCRIWWGPAKKPSPVFSPNIFSPNWYMATRSTGWPR